VAFEQVGDGGVGGGGEALGRVGGGVAQAGGHPGEQRPLRGRHALGRPLEQQRPLLQLQGDVAAGVELLPGVAAPGGDLVGPRLDRERPGAGARQGDLRPPAVQARPHLAHRHQLDRVVTGTGQAHRRGDDAVAVAEDGRLDRDGLAGDRLRRPAAAAHLRPQVLDHDPSDHGQQPTIARMAPPGSVSGAVPAPFRVFPTLSVSPAPERR
jgi:hypothetical protein